MKGHTCINIGAHENAIKRSNTQNTWRRLGPGAQRLRSGDALSAPERGEYCQLDYRHAYTLKSRLQISSSCPITAPQHPAVRRFLLALSTYERCDSPSPDTQPPLESSASHHHPRQQANHLMTCVDMMTCRMSPTSTKATTDPDPDPDMHTHTACNSQPSSSPRFLSEAASPGGGTIAASAAALAFASSSSAAAASFASFSRSSRLRARSIAAALAASSSLPRHKRRRHTL